jgi:hypothetical protein
MDATTPETHPHGTLNVTRPLHAAPRTPQEALAATMSRTVDGADIAYTLFLRIALVPIVA